MLPRMGTGTNHTNLIPISVRVRRGSTHLFFLYLSGGGVLSTLLPLLLSLVCRLCLRRKESTIKSYTQWWCTTTAVGDTTVC